MKRLIKTKYYQYEEHFPLAGYCGGIFYDSLKHKQEIGDIWVNKSYEEE